MSASSNSNSRRIDIDLLRAVAVLAVIFYHFEIPGFDGGFLGVDIFFVISGYLITLHIQQQLSESRFSFINFYVRRIRRLFPALIATMILSSIAALFILPKALLADFSHSQIATSMYASNIYFWFISDYFDTDSILKPLLHTWSLSVEEQFYLVWPLFLFVAFSRKPTIWIVTAAVISLLAAEVFFDISPSATFYLFPFRVFEFAVGALVCGRSMGALQGSLRTILLVVSCLSILLTLLFATEHSRNPGLWTLPLCIGTATIICMSHPWLNKRNTVTSIFLRIGLVSYSAYLVHWPLVVFYKIGNPQPLSPVASLCLFVITYALAEMFYNFVERPTAKISTVHQRALLVSSLPLTIVLALAFDAYQPRVYRLLNAEEFSVSHILDNNPDRRSALTQMKQEIREKDAESKPDKRRKIVVVGDSHAIDVSLALKYQFAGTDVEVLTMQSLCDPLTMGSLTISLQELYEDHPQEQPRNPDYCVPYHRDYLEKLVSLAPDLIIYSEAWRESALPFVTATISQTKKATSAEVLILGRNTTYVSPPNVLFRDLKDIDEIDAAAWERRQKRFDVFDKILSKAAIDSGSHFISKNELLCPANKCQMLIGSEIGYADGHHWSVAGMKVYGKILVDDEIFKSALAR